VIIYFFKLLVKNVSAYSKALTSPTPRRIISGCSPDKSTILVLVNVPKPPSINTSIVYLADFQYRKGHLEGLLGQVELMYW